MTSWHLISSQNYLTFWHLDILSSWHLGILTSRHLIFFWHLDILTSWHLGILTSYGSEKICDILTSWHFDSLRKPDIIRCQDVILTSWHLTEARRHKMSRCQNVKLASYQWWNMPDWHLGILTSWHLDILRAVMVRGRWLLGSWVVLGGWAGCAGCCWCVGLCCMGNKCARFVTPCTVCEFNWKINAWLNNRASRPCFKYMTKSLIRDLVIAHPDPVSNAWLSRWYVT